MDDDTFNVVYMKTEENIKTKELDCDINEGDADNSTDNHSSKMENNLKEIESEIISKK
jgi:hypothetical protein